MSSDRVEARRPGAIHPPDAFGARGDLHGAAPPPSSWWNVDARGLRLGDVLWARRSGAPFEHIRGRPRGPREQDRTMIEFYAEVVTVYPER